MKKILTLVVLSAAVGACGENKSSTIGGNGAGLFDNPPTGFVCPKKSIRTDLDMVSADVSSSRTTAASDDAISEVSARPVLDVDDRIAQAGLRDFFERTLADEKLFETYANSWMGKTRGPSLKPLLQEELDREVARVRSEARDEANMLIRKLGATQVKWTSIYDLMVRVVQAKYDNGNLVAPGTVKGKVLFALIWCADSML